MKSHPLKTALLSAASYLFCIFLLCLLIPLCLLFFCTSSCIWVRDKLFQSLKGLKERKEKKGEEGKGSFPLMLMARRTRNTDEKGQRKNPGSWAMRAALRRAVDWLSVEAEWRWTWPPRPLHSAFLRVCLVAPLCPAPYTEQHITWQCWTSWTIVIHKTDS